MTASTEDTRTAPAGTSGPSRTSDGPLAEVLGGPAADDGHLRTPWTVLEDYQCFGCSPHNAHGLRLRFRERPDGISTTFQLGPTHESYPGVVHGGLLGVICDETMGNLIVLRVGQPAFTTAMRVRFLAPVLVGAVHECRARIIPGADGSTLINTEADVVDAAGTVVATARATYRPVALEAARDRIQISDDAAGRLARVLAATADAAGRPLADPPPTDRPVADEPRGGQLPNVPASEES
ncbi:thioesterase [Frankia sp. CcI49]|uniref:PaaI family thioesterase n=1 Tax=unclassified Frankia TaxID=2632575 RepID=UPI0006CA4B91|nr:MULTISPECIES: PaaI family thioesterase [unclassified Frankia]KPM51561.1 thioesterase [Frankia sp. R43]ONH61867.1 thioesterase [Frankia sp. CcI49]